MLHRREYHGLLMHCDHLMGGNGLAVGLFQPKGPSHKPPVGCLQSIAQCPEPPASPGAHAVQHTHSHTAHGARTRHARASGGTPWGPARGVGGRQRHAARLVPNSQELFCVSTDCLGPMYTSSPQQLARFRHPCARLARSRPSAPHGVTFTLQLVCCTVEMF